MSKAEACHYPMEDTDEDMPWDFNPSLRRLTAQLPLNAPLHAYVSTISSDHQISVRFQSIKT